MEHKNRPVQLDLFVRGREEAPRRTGFFERLSSQIVFSLENAIIFAIFIVLGVLLAFSVGVEKGKRQVQKDLKLRFDLSTGAKSDIPVAAKTTVSDPKPVKTTKMELFPEKTNIKEGLKIKSNEDALATAPAVFRKKTR